MLSTNWRRNVSPSLRIPRRGLKNISSVLPDTIPGRTPLSEDRPPKRQFNVMASCMDVQPWPRLLQGCLGVHPAWNMDSGFPYQWKSERHSCKGQSQVGRRAKGASCAISLPGTLEITRVLWSSRSEPQALCFSRRHCPPCVGRGHSQAPGSQPCDVGTGHQSKEKSLCPVKHSS